MRLSRIRPLQQLRHRLLPLRRRGRHRVLQRLVEAHRVRHGGGITPRPAQITQVVHGHARDNDEDVLVTERGDCLAETVVLDRVLSVEERGLDDGDA